MRNLERSGCAGLALAGVFVCAALLAAGPFAPARAAGPVGGGGDAPLLDLRVDGPLVSADLRDAPLGEVLRELAARWDFELATDAESHR